MVKKRDVFCRWFRDQLEVVELSLGAEHALLSPALQRIRAGSLRFRNQSSTNAEEIRQTKRHGEAELHGCIETTPLRTTTNIATTRINETMLLSNNLGREATVILRIIDD
jgi:hypothetical protein